MPHYLAFQFPPRHLTRRRLRRIIEEYYSRCRHHEDWEENPVTVDDWFADFDCNMREYGMDMGLKATLLEKVGYVMGDDSVHKHPLLSLQIIYGSRVNKSPDDFSGLSVWADHSGLEGLVDLIEFKPEIGGFLGAIGIEYEDRSRVPTQQDIAATPTIGEMAERIAPIVKLLLGKKK